MSIWADMPRYSHVMIGIGGGLVIHADGKRVSIDVLSDVITPEIANAGYFVVYRHRNMPLDKANDIVNEAYRYYSQSYGFSPYFRSLKKKWKRREDTTQFCSRLVAHAFRAAGYSLTTLADVRVLPIDLYRICQGDEWLDVTSDLIDMFFSPKKELFLSEIDGISMPDFWQATELLMREAAENRRNFLDIVHKSAKSRLQIEAELLKLVSLRLELVKMARHDPEVIDAKLSDSMKKVLAQLPELLDLALLPDLSLLIESSTVNMTISGDKHRNQAPFIGFPTDGILQKMRMQREAGNLFWFLLMGELGMLIIAAKLTPQPELEFFQIAAETYADEFLGVVPVIDDDLSMRLNAVQNGFLWVESESERDICRKICCVIIAVLQSIVVARMTNK